MNENKLNAALDALANQYPGPGGVAGVVHEGRVVASRAWGYKNLGTAEPMTRATRLPICSISKQFTCGVLLDQIGDADRLNDRVARYLPALETEAPRVTELAHNQSGLRDYWALSVLQGGRAEQTFGRGDALPLLGTIRTGHFPPGTGYSYNNGNFRILAELIEAETGRSLEELYREVIWDPAGMKTAELTPDTRQPADGVVGYEGCDATGFFPADNGIYWRGDAGISASLDDMLAYEAWIDATRDAPDGLYRRMSARPTFRDGSAATYGYGLAHMEIAGLKATGHAGALRGFRSVRFNLARERLSIVVIFNHEANMFGAAFGLLHAALDIEAPKHAPVPEGWDGQWICRGTGLLARMSTAGTDATLRFSTFPDVLHVEGDGLKGGEVTVAREGDALRMRRAGENLEVVLDPLEVLSDADGGDLAGRYVSEETGGAVEIESRDGGVYCRFEGILGTGIMERVHPAGPDVWIVATRRSMDAPAPGDWTLRVRRDGAGAVAGFELGCWLARGIGYVREG
ncbi:D-aminopeptidase [Amaricoccus tamworthensis]|uniref:D-aminopeptidase n=1 Tax=Amaricoccus tamworthensis TaxID=57002 RepID=UPI003C79BFAA